MDSQPDRTETDLGGAAASLGDAGALLGDTPPPAPGRLALPLIDPENYEVHGEIARGGMGRILRATDRRLEREVAIKQLLVSSPRLARLFEREVRITARLQHPAIVNVYEAGVLPSGELFYAMKLVAGRSLSDVIAETRSLAERIALLPAVIAVCEALAYSHRRRVIHRDLKPSNVLVGDFGETVVIDWRATARTVAISRRTASPSSGRSCARTGTCRRRTRARRASRRFPRRRPGYR